MGKKRHTAEEIVSKSAAGGCADGAGPDRGRGPAADRRDGGQLRDELLKGEIFYTLQEAKVIIENWRRHYNTMRPRQSRPRLLVVTGKALSCSWMGIQICQWISIGCRVCSKRSADRNETRNPFGASQE